MSDKKQFNVYLPPELIREVKHASVDSGNSLSDFVENALRAYLEKQNEASKSDKEKK